jgi:4'-phosphopantetheinyl transferase
MYKILNITKINPKKYYNILNVNDNNKINKFLNYDDKMRALGSIILQKEYISNIYNDICLKDIIIEYTKYGKPYYKNLNYNISHDNDLVIIVYSNTENSIGVDIMKYRQINICNYYNNFTLKEREKITNNTFLNYWCAKEAFIKAIGFGLTIDLKTIEFIIDENTIIYDNQKYLVNFLEIQDYICAYVQIPEIQS